MLCPNAQFIQRVKTTGTRCGGGLEAQNFIVAILVSPSRGEFVVLVLESVRITFKTIRAYALGVYWVIFVPCSPKPPIRPFWLKKKT